MKRKRVKGPEPMDVDLEVAQEDEEADTDEPMHRKAAEAAEAARQADEETRQRAVEPMDVDLEVAQEDEEADTDEPMHRKAAEAAEARQADEECVKGLRRRSGKRLEERRR